MKAIVQHHYGARWLTEALKEDRFRFGSALAELANSLILLDISG